MEILSYLKIVFFLETECQVIEENEGAEYVVQLQNHMEVVESQ